MAAKVPAGERAMPYVPISDFKKNPAGYLAGGAVVTTHGRPRAVFTPVAGEPDLAGIKDQLRLLSRMLGSGGSAAEAASVLSALGRSRGAVTGGAEE